jgi:hypothetical protein
MPAYDPYGNSSSSGEGSSSGAPPRFTGPNSNYMPPPSGTTAQTDGTRRIGPNRGLYMPPPGGDSAPVTGAQSYGYDTSYKRRTTGGGPIKWGAPTSTAVQWGQGAPRPRYPRNAKSVWGGRLQPPPVFNANLQDSGQPGAPSPTPVTPMGDPNAGNQQWAPQQNYQSGGWQPPPGYYVGGGAPTAITSSGGK